MPPKDDPLNLMRVIPSQGARIRSHAALPRMVFYFYGSDLSSRSRESRRPACYERRRPTYHDRTKDSKNGGTTAVSSSDQLPNSRKVYVPGQVHPDLRVPFREISPRADKNNERRD